jgi:hypothetical protein
MVVLKKKPLIGPVDAVAYTFGIVVCLDMSLGYFSRLFVMWLFVMWLFVVWLFVVWLLNFVVIISGKVLAFGVWFFFPFSFSKFK